MAKSSGAHHSDLVKGSIGPITHRVYRGVGTVSRHRSTSRVKFKRPELTSPQDLSSCWARFNLGTGYTLRSAPPDLFIKNLSDLVGGLGTLSQGNSAFQPKWFASDPTHNSRPYCLPDGSNDFMDTPVLPVVYSQPLEIWIVMANSPFDATTRAIFRLYSISPTYFARSNIFPQGWVWYPSGTKLLAPQAVELVRIWRIKIISNTAQVFWNGIAQSIPKSITSPNYNYLRLFSVSPGTGCYNKKLFEICFFNAILNPVEAKLLLRFYREWFNI